MVDAYTYAQRQWTCANPMLAAPDPTLACFSSQIRCTDSKWQCSYPLKATFVFPVDEILQGPVLHIIHSSLPIISVIVLPESFNCSSLAHRPPFFYADLLSSVDLVVFSLM